MSILKRVIKFFDKLEDVIRAGLSRMPLLYSIIGGIGVVLFWRGVWMMADDLSFMTGPVSTLAGLIILMLIGLMVSVFVGDRIIISGLKREQKVFEKARLEIEEENRNIADIETEVRRIRRKITKGKKKNIK